MREKMYKTGKLCMVAAIAVGMIAEPITADIVGISSIQTITKVNAQPTNIVPSTTYSEPSPNDPNVAARGRIGAASWYLDNQGILHIGPGQAQGVSGTFYHGAIYFSNSANYFTATNYTGGSNATVLPSYNHNGFKDNIKQIYIDPGFKMPAYSAYLFSEMHNLTAIYGLSKVDISAVRDMSGIFGGDPNLTDVGDLSNWDVSNVTNMSSMFWGAGVKNIGNLDKWNVGKVTNIGGMFAETPSLTNIGDLSNWDTSNVTDMMSMFYGASSLTNIGNLSKWNTSNVTNMSFMFEDSSPLTNIGDLSNWNTSNVTTMREMFESSLLTNIGDLSKWNTSKVTNMRNMFSDAENLNELNLLNWTVSSNTNTQDMFSGMTSLKKITFGPNWTAWVTVPNAVNGSTLWQGTTNTNNKFLATYKSSPVDVTGATNNADTYVLTPTAKTEIVTTDNLSGSAKVGDNQTGSISQTGKLSFTVAGGDKGTITMALAKESSNVITGLHLASVKDDLEGTAKDYDITAGASTQIGTYSINGTHNYSIDPSKSNIKLNSTFAKPGTYTAATTYTMNNTPNA